MTKKFKLIGIESQKVYFESAERSELQRWLDDEFGTTETGVRKNIEVQPMPEAMRIVEQTKG
ncbi:hypothetical protein [Carnobacterium maltaromaticum]|uniref:hypothetical protein n=1 Tax=Carnobacterium maltaromaticum TaxID=2751 RepID=UPI00191BC79E|nr:hypothetical protein [Carnobacterium maltaromaticum]CAD5903204.1 conserved hypothetical protein [Carnobacterium maltaromaticum]